MLQSTPSQPPTPPTGVTSAEAEPVAMAPVETALVEAQGLGVRRGGRWLVHDLDFSLRRGQITTLIGPNGAGKTTAAKLALGIMQPDAGTVRRAAGLRIGYVPQRISIEPTLPLTVKRLMTLTASHGADDVAAALDAVGIAHLAAAPVHHLSGGEFQRALLARAIVRKPDLLVLDEPVQGVDFAGQVALYELIQRIRADTGCGILHISHDLHVVMAHTDNVLCLNGHMCCSGTPESVAANPEYLALFGSTASDALAVYHHRHEHTHLVDGSIQHADGSVTEAADV